MSLLKKFVYIIFFAFFSIILSGINHNCCKSTEIIIQLITEVNKKVTDLKESFRNSPVSFSKKQLDIINNKLPCRTVEELEQLEFSILTDKKQEESLRLFMNSIGGTTGRDFTQRVFKKVLTNELAEMCSWTGAKNNYELQKLSIVECAYDAVYKHHQITRKEFEVNVKDWLRHARQRRERENKRSEK